MELSVLFQKNIEDTGSCKQEGYKQYNDQQDKWQKTNKHYTEYKRLRKTNFPKTQKWTQGLRKVLRFILHLLHPLFNYIVTVSFIGGRNRGKTSTVHKLKLFHIVLELWFIVTKSHLYGKSLVNLITHTLMRRIHQEQNRTKKYQLWYALIS